MALALLFLPIYPLMAAGRIAVMVPGGLKTKVWATRAILGGAAAGSVYYLPDAYYFNWVIAAWMGYNIWVTFGILRFSNRT